MIKETSEARHDLWSDRKHPVREDMAFQRATWRFERIGWYLFAGVILAALLGFFSEGPFSSRLASDPTGRITLSYDRFVRDEGVARMALRIVGAEGESLTVRLGGDLPGAFIIEAMQPQPQQASSGPQGLELTFPAPAQGPFILHLALRPDSFGETRSEVALPDGTRLRFSQFIYP